MKLLSVLSMGVICVSAAASLRPTIIKGFSGITGQSIEDYYASKDYKEYLKTLEEIKLSLKDPSSESSDIFYNSDGTIAMVNGILPELEIVEPITTFAASVYIPIKRNTLALNTPTVKYVEKTKASESMTQSNIIAQGSTHEPTTSNSESLEVSITPTPTQAPIIEEKPVVIPVVKKAIPSKPKKVVTPAPVKKQTANIAATTTTSITSAPKVVSAPVEAKKEEKREERREEKQEQKEEKKAQKEDKKDKS